MPHPTFVDVGKNGPSPGDQVVLRDDVNRDDGGAPGRLRQVCTLVEPGRGLFTSAFSARARSRSPRAR